MCVYERFARVAARECVGRESNLRPVDRNSSTLTTARRATATEGVRETGKNQGIRVVI